jgi:hypothetical protein
VIFRTCLLQSLSCFFLSLPTPLHRTQLNINESEGDDAVDEDGKYIGFPLNISIEIPFMRRTRRTGTIKTTTYHFTFRQTIKEPEFDEAIGLLALEQVDEDEPTANWRYVLV